ncbi:glycosyltransferase family 39 protein [Candidatus Poribacteria bacterium]|nr:glycosyltransferase family 39 protein [Candidatus Poribacteria bacterium]
MHFLRKAVSSIVGQIALFAVFFFLYHKLIVYIMRETGLKLGAVGYNGVFTPLYAIIRPELSWWVIPAILICSGFLFISYKYLLSNKISTSRLIALSIIFFIAITISVAQIDGYNNIGNEENPNWILSLLEPYTRTGMEYYGDVPRIEDLGLGAFLRDFSKPELFDTLSGHTRTHPAGGVVFLWLVSKIFGYNLLSASLFSILFTSVIVILIYKLGEHLYDKTVALYALLLFLITPNFVMFTGTSMDGPFSVFPILSLYLFYKARERETNPDIDLTTFRPYSLLTGISLAIGMFMTYSTVVIGVFLCVIAILEYKQFNQYLKVLAFAAVGYIGFYLLLYIIAGYDPITSTWAAIKKDEAGLGTGYESIDRFFHLSIGNLFAFLIGVGIPITAVWFRQVKNTFSDWRKNTTTSEKDSGSSTLPWLLRFEKADTYLIGFCITLFYFTFSTLFTMEVERIWIFMVPFFVIPVAKFLTTRPRSDLYWVGCLLVVQLILSEVLLYTYW